MYIYNAMRWGYINMYICVCVYISIHTDMCMYVYARSIYVCMYVCMCVCV
jgi:hypothetical protein